jgi:hypothetical protein
MRQAAITILRWTFGFAYAVLFLIVMSLMTDRGGWWILAGIAMILLTFILKAYLGETDEDSGSSGGDLFGP